MARRLLGSFYYTRMQGETVPMRRRVQSMNMPKAESFNTMWTWFSVILRNRSAHARVWLAAEFREARFHYVRFKAEKGDPSAEYRLGLIFEAGDQVGKSDYDAHKWFLRAAFHGIAAAQAKVSEYCREGRGVPRNDEEAFRWCRKAAEQGHAAAQVRLVEMYRDGIGVERNPKEAKKWENKVATQKIPFARAVNEQLTVCSH